MNAAAEGLPASRLGQCSSIDLMSRYIAITAQMRDGNPDDLAPMRDQLRELIVDRLGLEVATAFITEVERAAGL